MAEPLKNQFGPDVPDKIAGRISTVWDGFNRAGFLREALSGYEALDLKQRARQIAQTMRRHLPADYAQAIQILGGTLGPRLEQSGEFGMSVFLYFPHALFVAEYGLEHFDVSMQFQYELTQRFTAEFCIRPFLEHDPEKTLSVLRQWSCDPSEHVRRLVSEGTRPRLPWAPQLRGFRENPRPVLALLESLKDDPSLYVRRSVANNLNDIGKDHPALLAQVTRRWRKDATPEREWIVRHALRSAIKRGELGALEVLGYGKPARVRIEPAAIRPARPVIGGKVEIGLEITNPGKTAQSVLVDLRIHYVKASGKSSPKVFKLKCMELPPGLSIKLGKKLSLADKSTRKHYPGVHRVEALVNGKPFLLGEFHLRQSAK